MFDPRKYLDSFSEMAQKSRAFDGDWQGDGWGVAWLDENGWQVKKLLLSVWQDKKIFTSIPRTKSLVVHARSASFPSHKGNINFNQPFISGEYAFVFNGLLHGVKLPVPVPGQIGAQKIWYLLQTFLKKYPPAVSLEKIKTLLISHTSEIQALNIGLADKKNIYSLNYFTKHPQYYTLHYEKKTNFELISSEKLS